MDNIRQTGEFVINLPPVEMAEEVMICAKNFPPEVDEFEMAGPKARPSMDLEKSKANEKGYVHAYLRAYPRPYMLPIHKKETVI